MKTPVYLHCPGVVSALGDDLAATWQRLWQKPADFLSITDQWTPPRTLPVGAVTLPLRPFAKDTPPPFLGRNNQLLWHAAGAVEAQISAVKSRFGAERVAVLMATSNGSMDENRVAFQHVANGGPWADSGFNQVQQCLVSPAEFMSAQYGLRGLRYVISTACTSGARAIISAARLLRSNLADAVVVGGVDCLSALTINGFAALSVLSDEIAAPFAPQRRGINIGEAAAVFVISREPLFDEALPLLGYGVGSDAYHMSSPRPDGLGAQQSIQAALHSADLPPQAIGWVNLHGTGTEHNDAMESLAVAACLGNTVCCTSTKPHTGHTLAAAGALEAALLWASISRRINPDGQLPPQYLPRGQDPDIAPIHLSTSTDGWRLNQPRIGLSTSFAFGGSNAALIIGSPQEAA
ncbi:beta-ketoacyl synthase N-terminal-like domain-containing protein [Stenoxybacter acetivorans]|uniref:beta-ketoacyl synthase N-terminal-like domain-containing protein n=1 Tax=Stenoxybacter acetivorans TaxID=422441 RepID=UPI00056A995B|nr:beta-ketoacyl synthase N-terminal-like domain-containing protein [Stenoxybacter acetivorans]